MAMAQSRITDDKRLGKDIEWLAILRPYHLADETGIKKLHGILLSALRRTFPNRELESHLEDFVQDALIRIQDNLASYRSEGSFTTWAISIAIRVAYTDLRRAKWRAYSLEELDLYALLVPQLVTDPKASPEKQSAQREILETLRSTIAKDLTDRQRQALLAELAGMPQAAIAEKLKTNQNNIYKLVHDARVRLRALLLAKGIKHEYINWAFDM
jgi:RNA polymerase sigma factor (sigma-70 family)